MAEPSVRSITSTHLRGTGGGGRGRGGRGAETPNRHGMLAHEQMGSDDHDNDWH
eukprot:COSAG01_NODE_6206_length_3796_cov_1.330268_2_plen_54_part_00